VDCGDIPVCDDEGKNCKPDDGGSTDVIEECPASIDCKKLGDGANVAISPCGAGWCTCVNGKGQYRVRWKKIPILQQVYFLFLFFTQECPDGLVFDPTIPTCVPRDLNPSC